MIYEFKCTVCGIITEEVMSYKDMDRWIWCDCGGISKRIPKIYTPHVHVKGGRTDLYPMVNPTLVDKVVLPDGTIERRPVVWNSYNDRVKYMKDHHLVDAVIPESEKSTQNSDDFDIRDRTAAEDLALDNIQRRNPATTVRPRFVEVNDDLEVCDVA